MQITADMIDRAAKVLRRLEYPVGFDPRPWRQIAKERFRERARRALEAALTPRRYKRGKR